MRPDEIDEVATERHHSRSTTDVVLRSRLLKMIVQSETSRRGQTPPPSRADAEQANCEAPSPKPFS